MLAGAVNGDSGMLTVASVGPSKIIALADLTAIRKQKFPLFGRLAGSAEGPVL